MVKGKGPKGKQKTDGAKELSMGKSDSATNIRKHFTAIKLCLQKRNAGRCEVLHMYEIGRLLHCYVEMWEREMHNSGLADNEYYK